MPLELTGRLAHRLRTMVPKGPPSGPHRACVLAVASGKGGVGKTTSAVNLAMWYAHMGHPTLIIDLDPQAHVATALGAGVARHEADAAAAQSLGEVLLGRRRDVFEVAEATRWKDLSVASSRKDLAEVEMVLAAKIGKEMLLKEALHEARSHYAFIVIDCPPNLGTLTLNALCAADALLVPADMSMLAFEGVADILQAVETLRGRLHQPLRVGGIFCTRVDRRQRNINKVVETSLRDAFGDLMMRTQIPSLAAYNRAHLTGEPLLEGEPHSVACLAYRALACELAERLGLGIGDSRSAPSEEGPSGPATSAASASAACSSPASL